MINSDKENLRKIVTPPSFIKLAMRNMVRKGNKSISHFFIKNNLPFFTWAIGLENLDGFLKIILSSSGINDLAFLS